MTDDRTCNITLNRLNYLAKRRIKIIKECKNINNKVQKLFLLPEEIIGGIWFSFSDCLLFPSLYVMFVAVSYTHLTLPTIYSV